MFAAETESEINVNRRSADFAASLSDIVGAAGGGTDPWQYVRLTAREVCYTFCLFCSRAKIAAEA